MGKSKLGSSRSPKGHAVKVMSDRGNRTLPFKSSADCYTLSEQAPIETCIISAWTRNRVHFWSLLNVNQVIRCVGLSIKIGTGPMHQTRDVKKCRLPTSSLFMTLKQRHKLSDEPFSYTQRQGLEFRLPIGHYTMTLSICRSNYFSTDTRRIGSSSLVRQIMGR